MYTYIYSTPSTIGASIYTYILNTCIFNLGHIYTTIHTYIAHCVSRYIHTFSICAYQRANRRADRRADRRAGRRADRLRAKATIDIDIYVVPDVLPTAISVKSVMSDKSSGIDTPDAVVSSMEVTVGSPPAEIDISKSPEVLQRAVSVMAVVSEKWMERFVINPKVLCSDGLAPDDDPARRSSDVGSDACVIQDPIPTAVSVRTVVAEEWMDRFVLDLVECPSVSRTSAVARTFGPAVSEEYSPVVFAGGGGGAVADAYPLVVVESDTAPVSGLQLVKSDTARVSVLPVAGCKFRAIFLGNVALDMVGLGVCPLCLQVDSEETLLNLTDERAQSARAAPGVTPVDSSEMGAPVRKLIWPSVLGEP